MWDEDYLIVNDPRVHHWSHLPGILKGPFFGGKTAFTVYYRPLSTLSFLIDHLFWGLNPFGYHLTNLLLHLANTLFIYAIYRHFLKNVQLAFWGAFLFLAHPAHVEAVTYIPSRTDVLSFFFFLASFHFYLKGREAIRKFWPYAGSVLCYGFALFSKERAAFLPLLILAHAFLVNRERTRFKGAEGAFFLGMFFCAAGYAFVRRYVSIQRPLLGLLDIPRLPLRLFVLPEVLFSYAKIWFFPWPLHMGRIIPIEALKVHTLMFEWSFFLVTLLSLLFFFRKPIERFWLVWVAVSMLPVIQIFPIYFFGLPHLSLAVSEYLLYFGSVGIIGLLASRWGSFFVVEGKANILTSMPTVLLGATLTLFSFSVIWRNSDYRDRIALFEQTVQYAPWHAVGYNQLGLAYLDAGELQKAETLFRKSISMTNDEYPYVNLGLVALERGEFEKAEGYFKKAHELNPGYGNALHDLGILCIIKKDWWKAIEYFNGAIKVDSNMFPMTYIERGHAYWELGEKKRALEAVEEGLKVHPEDRGLQTIKRWMKEKLQKES